MIIKSILNQAKAYLCWDLFQNLTIQLVEIKKAVSYFYPPSQQYTIIIYFEKGATDFSIPLYLLFHEAGHYLQYQDFNIQEREKDFWKIINTPTGPDKAAFEKESWIKGRVILEGFLRKQGLDNSILKQYDMYADQCILSYK
jgi:hypothetical protein